MFSFAPADAAVLVPVPHVPNATATMVFGINDSNVIVGSAVSKNDRLERGFYGPLGGPYTSFDAGPGGTRALAISNDGHVVGYANSQDGETDTQPVFERWPGGKTRTVMDAGSPVYGAASGIANATNAFVGDFWDWGDYAISPFRGHHGQWSRDIRLSGFQFSAATGINSTGVIVGFGATDHVHGFVLNGNRKSIALVDFPGNKTDATELHGINDNGQAAGQWFDIYNTPHGFVLDLATNTFTEIKVRGATHVQAWGINSAGAIAVTSDKGSFIWCAVDSSCPSSGAAIRVDAPVHRGTGKPIRLQ
ncbi:MAG TPA: hypothetical protein VGG69_07805 [Rhizomicrobium sp.]